MTSGCTASNGFGATAIVRWLIDRGGHGGRRVVGLRLAFRGAAALLALLIAPADAQADTYTDSGVGSQSQRRPPPHQWTTFVHVDGQPEAVPAEWVATPEGRFAHSLKIPDPVPKDSGYRWWMSSKDYFKHLCDTEAGEFIYDKVENVEGFLFMRPPTPPSDSDLMDKYKLEAPGFEGVYQVLGDSIGTRGTFFVSSSRPFKFVEEPNLTNRRSVTSFLHASGSSKALELDDVKVIDQPLAEFEVTWRGVRRHPDRESRVAGFELIVLRRNNQHVVAVLRDFLSSAVSGGRVNWLSASYCPNSKRKYIRPQLNQTPEFLARVLTGNQPKKLDTIR